MRRFSPALVIRLLGICAWLLVGALVRPGAAQQPNPPAALPSFAEVVTAEETPESVVQPIGATAWTGRTDIYPFGQVAFQSIFGQADPDTWRPLLLSTVFSEGWREAWVPSPNGSGGAPRQGWINAADGNFYRLWWFTFAQAFNQGDKSNAYLGAYTLYTPLSRRLLLITNIPFVERNGVPSGLPIASGPGGLNTPRTHTVNQTTFGDITFTPRVLLHETQDWSFTSEVAVTVPTGNQPLTGKTALTPAIGFWNNFAGRWVIPGGGRRLDPTRRRWA